MTSRTVGAVAVSVLFGIGAAACGGSAHVARGPTTRHTRVFVSIDPDCYSGKLLSLSRVVDAFARHGVPLRQDAPPHGHLDWLTVRQRLPKHDYAWLWLNTVPYQPCGRTAGQTSVKNLEIAYQTPAVLSQRITGALNALRRIPTGRPPGAVAVTQVESAFAGQHFKLRGRGMPGLPGALLTAAGLPRGATLAVLVEQQHGNIVGFASGRWPFRERNFGNLSVAYDLPATLARRAEAAISELRAASARA